MTAVRSPMHACLRRRLAIAVVIACAALSGLAGSAGARSNVLLDCKPTDAVCVNTAAKAPSPAPADQTARDNAAKAAATRAAVKVSTRGTSFWDDLSTFALTWGPLIFMCAIVVLIGMTMRFMPRTKPQEIKPETSQSIRWEDVAGAD